MIRSRGFVLISSFVLFLGTTGAEAAMALALVLVLVLVWALTTGSSLFRRDIPFDSYSINDIGCSAEEFSSLELILQQLGARA